MGCIATGFASSFTHESREFIEGRTVRITYMCTGSESMSIQGNPWNAFLEGTGVEGDTFSFDLRVQYNGFGFVMNRGGLVTEPSSVIDIATGECLIDACSDDTIMPPEPPSPTPGDGTLAVEVTRTWNKGFSSRVTDFDA